MLILSRKRNERIVIDEEIVVTVVEVRGDKVRLGIQAPRARSVHRWEVWACIQEEGGSNGQKSQIEERHQESPGVGSERNRASGGVHEVLRESA